MNIGVDIDGVLTNIAEFTLKQGTKYCEENHTGKLINPNSYDSEKVFGWDAKTDLDFWTKNIFLYAETNPPIPKAAETIQRLKQEGHMIYIITARWLANTGLFESAKLDRPQENTENAEKMRTTVKKWLANNNICYDQIIFSGEDKSSHIVSKQIEVMIEDSPSNLQSLSKLTKMICYDWPYNQEINHPDIFRCHNWDEIYQTIQKLVKGEENKK